MQEEELMLVMLLSALFGGWASYLWTKARVTRQFLERWGDAMLRGRPVEERSAPQTEDLRRIGNAVELMAHRFDLMEQRLDFTERLLEREQGQKRGASDLTIR